jgi:hypothetical protein
MRMKNKFEDIQKGDIVFFFSISHGLIMSGVATQFIPGDDKNFTVDVWMVNSDEVSVPVTPTSFRGLKYT